MLDNNVFQKYFKEKDNLKSEELRKLGNDTYRSGELKESVIEFSRSLRYATYNSNEYGLALASRSAAFFTLKEYELCVRDGELCLNTDYPENLKPKILIRLAKCYSYMRIHEKMQEHLQTCRTLIKTISDKKVADNYIKDINNLTKEFNIKIPDTVIGRYKEAIPSIEENRSFSNAANSLKLVYEKKTGPHVIASQDINCGEVLFVEKAYSFDYHYHNIKELHPDDEILAKLHCAFCAIYDEAVVPCKGCVKVVYCTEKCRDEAWNEYHQWECGYLKIGVKLSKEASLALHTVCKAAHTGIVTIKIDYNKETNSYNAKSKAYRAIYNYKIDIVKFKELFFQEFTSC